MKPLVDSDGAAKLLGTTPRTLRRWIERGLDIPLIRVSPRVLRFDVDDLEAWVMTRHSKSINVLNSRESRGADRSETVTNRRPK